MSEFRYFFCYQKKIKQVALRDIALLTVLVNYYISFSFHIRKKMDRFVVSRDTEKVFDRVEWSYFINYLNSV